MVLIGRRVELYARTGYRRLVLGRWVNLGDENGSAPARGHAAGRRQVRARPRQHDQLLPRLEIGAGTIVADWVYVCDFDHVYDDIHVPIKDQGIVKSPVPIGRDSWVGTKVTRAGGARWATAACRCPRRRPRRRPADVGPPRRNAGARGQGPRGGLRAKAATRAALEDIARKTPRPRARRRRGRPGDAKAARPAPRPVDEPISPSNSRRSRRRSGSSGRRRGWRRSCDRAEEPNERRRDHRAEARSCSSCGSRPPAARSSSSIRR